MFGAGAFHHPFGRNFAMSIAGQTNCQRPTSIVKKLHFVSSAKMLYICKALYIIVCYSCRLEVSYASKKLPHSLCPCANVRSFDFASGTAVRRTNVDFFIVYRLRLMRHVRTQINLNENHSQAQCKIKYVSAEKSDREQNGS